MSAKGIAVGVGAGAIGGALMGAVSSAAAGKLSWTQVAIGAGFGAALGGGVPPIVAWAERKFAESAASKAAAALAGGKAP